MKRITFLITGLFLVLSLSAQETPIVDDLYLIGNGTDAEWDNTNPIPLTKVEEGIFTWTGTLYAPSSDAERFKFLTEAGTWVNSITCQFAEEGHETVVLGQEMDLFFKGDPLAPYDNAFQIETTGEYKIDVDLNTYTMTIVDASTVGINDVSKESTPFSIVSNSASIGIVMDDSRVAESFEIYNTGGSLVYSKSNIDGSFYSEPAFAQGIYVVRVRSNNKVYSSKVVVK